MKHAQTQTHKDEHHRGLVGVFLAPVGDDEVPRPQRQVLPHAQHLHM